MIFVTVGTHEQQFNRLVEYIDNLKKDGILEEEVIIQTGFCTYEPKYCTYSKLYPYQDMLHYVDEARLVITHGGPSSFIMPLQVGKIPIVVPRKKDYDEHVNNHQLEFAREVEKRQKNIILVEEVEELEEVIRTYEDRIHSLTSGMTSHNARFNEEIEKIAERLVKGRNK